MRWLMLSVVVFGLTAMVAEALPPNVVPHDTGEEDTKHISDTGNSKDDTGDTGEESSDADTVDTAYVEGEYSAAELAGETGGFGCATIGRSGSAVVVVLSLTLLWIRRQQQ